jgi:hypothetical protein
MLMRDGVLWVDGARRGTAMDHIGVFKGDCRTRCFGREARATYRLDVWRGADGAYEARGRLIGPIDLLHGLAAQKNGLVFDLIGRGEARFRVARDPGYGPVADIVVEPPVLAFMDALPVPPVEAPVPLPA